MSYPKPLSERTLEKLYMQSGLSGEARNALHGFFAACANLYGAISLRCAWSVYQELKDVPKLRRKDFLAFAGIVRREDQPYYVFEIEELYQEEKHNELERHIVSKELVTVGYVKYDRIYELLERARQYPYCVPDDFFNFSVPVPTAEESALFCFLGALKSTQNECSSKHGQSIPNDNKGKRLCEFSFLNALERFDIEWYKKCPAILASVLEDCAGTEAEKIMRMYKRSENIGNRSPTESLQYLLDELNEAGVVMKESHVKKLLKLITEYHNNSRLWCTAGWTPNELFSLNPPSNSPTISFGPGIQKTFADGSMDKEELIQLIKELGMDVLE